MTATISSPKPTAARAHVYVIAEMAWGHNGSRDIAMQLLQGAKDAGADAIGIHLTSLPDYMVRSYQAKAGKTTSVETPGKIYEYLEKINLKENDWKAFIQAAAKAKIHVLAMCNDLQSVEFAAKQGVDAYVVPAAAFTEKPYLEKIVKLGKPLVLRIGGATRPEVEAVVRLAKAAKVPKVLLLHGIQLYPTDINLLQLAAIKRLREEFGCEVGLADHIDGDLEEAIALPPLAIAYGASAIEKHITVDRALKHEDFEAALGIEQFKRFVRIIRAAEQSIGDGAWGSLTPGEERYRLVSRKRTVAKHPLKGGAALKAVDIAYKRSDDGLDPSQADQLVGRLAAREIGQDEGLDLTNTKAAAR